MPGQIPNALNQLTEYLTQENARLDKEIKRQNYTNTVNEISQKFEQLGPETTQEDARQLFFETLATAAKNDAQEAIPFIQGLYNDTTQYVNTQKALKEDAAMKKALVENYGIHVEGDMTGEQTLKMYDLFFKSLSPQTVTTATGEQYLATLKLGPQGYVEYGDRFLLNATTYNQKLAYELKLAAAKRRASGNDNNQKSTYMVSVNTPTGKVKAPLDWDPSPNGGWYVKVGGKKMFYDPSSPIFGEIGKWESSSIIRTRDRRSSESQVKWATGNLLYWAGGIAALIRENKDTPDDLKRELRNVENQDLNSNAPATVQGLLTTEVKGPAGNQMRAYIDKYITDPEKHDRAIEMYDQLVTSYQEYGAAQEDYKRWSTGGEQKGVQEGGSAPPGPPTSPKPFKGDPNAVISDQPGAVSMSETQELTDEITNALSSDNDKFHEGMQKLVAKITNKDPKLITIEDWDNLSNSDKSIVIKAWRRAKGIK